MSHWATGVTVVTTCHDGEIHGMTVNSFSSLTVEPPLVLFCADRSAHTYGLVEASGVFAVNVLRAGQEEHLEPVCRPVPGARRRTALPASRIGRRRPERPFCKVVWGTSTVAWSRGTRKVRIPFLSAQSRRRSCCSPRRSPSSTTIAATGSFAIIGSVQEHPGRVSTRSVRHTARN